MNPVRIVIIGLSLFLAGCKETSDQPRTEPPAAQDASVEMDRGLQSMASAVSELKASADPGNARQQVGELWIQSGQLKRSGRNTRNIEGILSDLEANLRSNQQDPTARRHLANQLEYEIQALKRNNR